MTEPELITALTNASVDARAVVSVLTQYAQSNSDVTLLLSNNISYTLPGIEKQRNQFKTDFNLNNIAFTKDFGGAVAGQVITRNVFSVITEVSTTFSSGLRLTHIYTRNGIGNIVQILVNVYDALNNLLTTSTKNIVRVNGLVQSIT